MSFTRAERWSGSGLRYPRDSWGLITKPLGTPVPAQCSPCGPCWEHGTCCPWSSPTRCALSLLHHACKEPGHRDSKGLVKVWLASGEARMPVQTMQCPIQSLLWVPNCLHTDDSRKLKCPCFRSEMQQENLHVPGLMKSLGHHLRTPGAI